MRLPGGLKFLDFLALIISLGFTGASVAWALAPGPQRPQVMIQTPQGPEVYPLDQDRHLKVMGPLGPSLIEIRQGQVWFQESPCDNQLCVHQGHLTTHNQWAACLPNLIMVRIQGSPEAEEVDALSF